MPGSPMKRAVAMELERRAAAISTPGEPIGPLDIVHDFIAGGKTMTDLALDLGAGLKRNISASVITAYINRTDGGRAMLLQARELAAHAFAEEAIQIVDDADEDKTALLKARLRAEGRQWLAGKWNRKAYGNDQQQIAVNIDLGGLHLDALRTRQVKATVITPLLASGEPDFEVVADEG